MRDILKCRIWNPHTGAFVESGGSPMMLSNFFKHTATLLTVDGQAYEYHTGLQDKNGKDIYEGDIVIERSYPMYSEGLCNYRCAVVWYEDNACFGLEMYVVSNRVSGRSVPDSISEYSGLEVIGNKWDNLELLTGEKREESRP